LAGLAAGLAALAGGLALVAVAGLLADMGGEDDLAGALAGALATFDGFVAGVLAAAGFTLAGAGLGLVLAPVDVLGFLVAMA
jgi:hypothetical protein